MKKTVEELEAIRKETLDFMNFQGKYAAQKARVLVGMATCGLAAGAQPVFDAFASEVNKKNLADAVPVCQTGCIGMCRFEPMADVLMPGKETVTYVKLTPEKVAQIVNQHLVNGEPVTEYTLEAMEQKLAEENAQ